MAVIGLQTFGNPGSYIGQSPTPALDNKIFYNYAMPFNSNLKVAGPVAVTTGIFTVTTGSTWQVS
jgi:hypothetical protein